MPLLLQKKLCASFRLTQRPRQRFCQHRPQKSNNSAVERVVLRGLILDLADTQAGMQLSVRLKMPNPQTVDKLLPLGVDKAYSNCRLPSTAPYFPAGGNRFPVFQKSRIYAFFKVVNVTSRF
ncbi:hypothetical protein KCP70_07570 [Salmonella enterica subsp. enterica]|nr:hypothetical protein KCP70_07570 [Salmonella enterica subsp. enterica]